LLNKTHRVLGSSIMAFRNDWDGRSQERRLRGEPLKKKIGFFMFLILIFNFYSSKMTGGSKNREVYLRTHVFSGIFYV
jgi:hypothetical protein